MTALSTSLANHGIGLRTPKGETVNSDPKVTVVLPVYREPIDVIKRAADSIDGQTYGNISTLVVLDDPDNLEAREFLEEYCGDRERFSLKVNERNLGLASSLNSAIADIKDGCDLICRMDSDDIAHKERVEREVAYLSEHHLDLVGCFMNVVNEEGTFLYRADGLPTSASEVAKALGYNNCVMHPTWLGKAEILARGYRPIPLSEDYDFLLRLELDGYEIGNCPETLLDYTISSGSISRSSLFRQYLFQRELTRTYREGKVADVEEVQHKVDDVWTPAREWRFSRAYYQMNAFLGSASAAKRLAHVLPLIGALVKSHWYVGKAYRLARVRLIARQTLQASA